MALVLIVLVAFHHRGERGAGAGLGRADRQGAGTGRHRLGDRVVNGVAYALGKGEQICVGAGDGVKVSDQSLARVVYRADPRPSCVEGPT